MERCFNCLEQRKRVYMPCSKQQRYNGGGGVRDANGYAVFFFFFFSSSPAAVYRPVFCPPDDLSVVGYLWVGFMFGLLLLIRGPAVYRWRGDRMRFLR